MGHRGKRFAAVSLYIIILAASEGWNLILLFDIRRLMFWLAGITIYVLFDMREKATLKSILSSAGNASFSLGVLCSFLLIFYQCHETGGRGFSFTDLALNFLPLFYGGGLSFLLIQKEVPPEMEERKSNGELNNEQYLYIKLKEAGMTERETEVAKLMRKGLSNYGIAEELYITEATVKKHVSHIYEKLGITGRGQLTEYCSKIISQEKM